jgi:hypothetical protein
MVEANGAEGIFEPHFSLDKCKPLHIEEEWGAKYPNICWWLIWNANCILTRPSEVQDFGMGPQTYCTG